MILRPLIAALLLALPAAAGAGAAPPPGASTASTAPASPAPGDAMIFARRDFSAAATAPLVWRLDREGRAGEGFLPITDGRLTLSRVTADSVPMLEMRETGGGIDRVVGRYPAEGMDPVLVYFLETATRNVSALAGGNPDYIRNRIKAALRAGGTVEAGTGEAGTGEGARVRLIPLAGDAAARRMAGFDDLTLTFDLGPDGAPIAGLTAEAPGTGYALRLRRLP